MAAASARSEAAAVAAGVEIFVLASGEGAAVAAASARSEAALKAAEVEIFVLASGEGAAVAAAVAFHKTQPDRATQTGYTRRGYITRPPSGSGDASCSQRR